MIIESQRSTPVRRTDCLMNQGLSAVRLEALQNLCLVAPCVGRGSGPACLALPAYSALAFAANREYAGSDHINHFTRVVNRTNQQTGAHCAKRHAKSPENMAKREGSHDFDPPRGSISTHPRPQILTILSPPPLFPISSLS